MHQSINQLINRPFNHPPIQAINQSNQSIKQIIHPPLPTPPHRHQPSIINHHIILLDRHSSSSTSSSSSSSSTSPSSSSSVNQSITQSCQHKSISSQKLLKSKPHRGACRVSRLTSIGAEVGYKGLNAYKLHQVGHWKKIHPNQQLGQVFSAASQQPSFPSNPQLSAVKSFQVKWFKVSSRKNHGLWNLKMLMLTRFHRKSYHRHPCPNTRSRPGGNISTLDRLSWLNSQCLMPSLLPQHSIHLRNTEHNAFVSKYDLITLW